MEAAIGRKAQGNRRHQVTGDVEARICAIAFSEPPEEARRLAERFEWYYTPKYGNWLDMAEIEIGIMSRQTMGKPLPDLESFNQLAV